jgi:hypothetical protein
MEPIHARMHNSAGHLLDNAVSAVGILGQLVPTKGYHFPDNPYVEYEGTLVCKTVSSFALRKLAQPIVA